MSTFFFFLEIMVTKHVSLPFFNGKIFLKIKNKNFKNYFL
jgi:hypothetical protein